MDESRFRGKTGDDLVEAIMLERIKAIMLKYRSALKDELPKQRAAQASEIRNIRTRCRALIEKLEAEEASGRNIKGIS